MTFFGFSYVDLSNNNKGMMTENEKTIEKNNKLNLFLKIAFLISSIAVVIIFSYNGLIGTKTYEEFIQSFITFIRFR